jgi:hypothetical protein
MFKRFATALLLRRLVRTLDALASAATVQTQLLARLADHFAPVLAPPSAADRATIKAETGVSWADADDIALAEAFAARQAAHTGHTPDEDEVLIYLADEKTRDLSERLTARDTELARLMEDRR